MTYNKKSRGKLVHGWLILLQRSFEFLPKARKNFPHSPHPADFSSPLTGQNKVTATILKWTTSTHYEDGLRD